MQGLPRRVLAPQRGLASMGAVLRGWFDTACFHSGPGSWGTGLIWVLKGGPQGTDFPGRSVSSTPTINNAKHLLCTGSFFGFPARTSITGKRSREGAILLGIAGVPADPESDFPMSIGRRRDNLPSRHSDYGV